MFPSNPRSWALPVKLPDNDVDGRKGATVTGFGPVFFHAPYLVNLASADLAIQENSVSVLRFALERAARTGAEGVVVHAGSHRGMERSEGLAQVAGLTRSLLAESSSYRIIFELTAGGGEPIASLPSHAGELMRAIGRSKRVHFCLDTQHLFAAGFAWHSRGGISRLFSELEASIGFERVACIHVNDSLVPFASHRDRHETLGRGKIGLAPFRRLLGAKDLRGIPVILETPGELEAHADEVALLRRMVSTN